ncbi:hypothetical protein [Halapricum desulfuricans]|uniref:Uncharacterized protein n=1 Tax=Halapricum desulfuricans TaxID=2841257 RepID=A0A897N083_9EURY|nr:hypothetical protein [Halapricum desulfuricans]QSG06332.1 hypothetical protein HSR121_1999 [Halapricum desulfuricans]
MEDAGLSVEVAGFGATSTEYIEGSGEENGFSKGAFDLYVPDRDAYVEVTGTDVPISPSSEMWVRPDKIEQIIAQRGEKMFVAHVLDSEELIRVIDLDPVTAKYLLATEDRRVRPTINGNREEYVAIRPTDPWVKPLTYLIEGLQN